MIVALAKKASPSWEATKESVAFLEKCRNRGSREVTDDDVWSTTLNDFVKAVFRDLSPLKDEAAMDLFKEVADRVVHEVDEREVSGAGHLGRAMSPTSTEMASATSASALISFTPPTVPMERSFGRYPSRTIQALLVQRPSTSIVTASLSLYTPITRMFSCLARMDRF